MSFTIKNKWILLGAGIVLIGVFLLGGYLSRQRLNRQHWNTLTAYADTIRQYRYKIDTLEKMASEKNQIIVSLSEAYKLSLIEKEEQRKLKLKAITEKTSLEGEIRILKDSLAHTGNVIIIQPCDSTKKPRPAIELPFIFGDTTKYHNISGGFDVRGKMNIGVSVPLGDVDIWTGIKKGSKTPVAIVTTTNPEIFITNIRSVKIDVPKPFYDKLWFRVTTLGIAFVGGVFVAK